MRILTNSYNAQIYCLYMDTKYRFLDLKQAKINTPAKNEEKS